MARNLTLFLISTLLLVGCYQDNNQTETTTIVEYPETIVETAGVSGSIVYHDGSLAQVQNLTFNGENSESEKPYFFFEAKNINQYFEVLQITHENGNILSYPLTSTANASTHHTIVIPNLNQIVDVQGDKINLNLKSGLELQFDNINFKEGELASTQPDIYFEQIHDHTIPGNRQGMTKSQQPMLLNGGEVFYLGWKDTNLSMQSDITTSEVGSKGLFFLNPGNGIWVEHKQGTAFYSGFYAYAESLLAEAINIDVNTTEINNLLELQIIVDGNILSKQAIGSTRRARSFIPLEQDFEIVISSSGMTLADEPYFVSQPADIEIELGNTGLELLEIQVSTIDCFGNKLENNILEITTESGYIRSIPLVDELIKILRPESEEVNLRVLSGKDEVSTVQQVFVNENKVVLGRQVICDSFADEFLYFYTEGSRNLLGKVTVLREGTSVQIIATDQNMDILFELDFEVEEEGKVEDEKINISLDTNWQDSGFKVNCSQSTQGCGFDDFEVTLFESPGNPYIKAVFEGEFWMESLADNSVGYRWLNGEFQVRLP